MDDSADLRDLLDGWPYDPEDTVRLAQGSDGREILQVRTPLGIEQYEMDGRPDGVRPHGCESLLEYQQRRLRAAQAAARRFALDAEECADLFHEGMLYYFRYLHCFELKRWDRTSRDTGRNLGLFNFVAQHAAREEDRVHLEKWRPYLLRMNAVADAMPALEQEDAARALSLIDQAIRRIESLPALENETFEFERERSLGALREMRDQLTSLEPPSERVRLEQALRDAIDEQAFERAAELRDRIRDLREREGPP